MLRKGYYFLSSLKREKNGKDRVLLRFKRLKEIVENAYESSSLYRSKYDEVHFHPEMFRSMEDFSRIPIITRNDLADFQGLLVDPLNPKKDHLLRTSGTMGEPSVIVHDPIHIDISTAYFAKFMVQVGFRPGHSFAIYRRPDTNLIKATTFTYHTLGLVTKFWIDSSLSHVRQWEILDKSRPNFIVGYPNALRAVGLHLREDKLNVYAGLKAIISYGERLSETNRTFLETTFGCPVYNWYSTTEFWSMARECKSGKSLHVEEDLVYLETLVDGRPVTGIKGDIVCTGLTGRKMPLIRYLTGDQCVITERNCTCGSQKAVIVELGGYRCMPKSIISKFTQAANHLDAKYLTSSELNNFQFVLGQNRESAILLVKPGTHFNERTLGAIGCDVRNLVEDTPFTIREVTDIPTQPSGKFSHVSSTTKPVFDTNIERVQ